MAQKPVERFGNSLSNQKANIWMYFALCTALFSLFIIFSERELRDIGKALLLAAIPLTAYVPTFLFRLQFDTDTVSHLFLGRVLLSRKPVSDLTRVEIGGAVGARLTFLDGSSIWFLGADIRLLRDMCRYIDKRWPDQVTMRWNLALSALLTLDRKSRRDA